MLRIYKSGSVELCQESFNVVDFPIQYASEQPLLKDPLTEEPHAAPHLDGQTEISDDKPLLLDPKEVEAILRNAQLEADRILRKAEDTAQSARQAVLEDARVQAEEITRQAYLEGQARGYAEGAAAKVTQIEELIAQLEETVARMEGSQSGFLAQYESDLRWMALELCSKVLHRTVERDELELLETVKDAVEQMRGAEWIDLHLSAQSTQLIERLQRELGSIRELEIIPDDLPAGSCLVDTPNLQLDASIDAQLENLKEYLKLLGNQN